MISDTLSIPDWLETSLKCPVAVLGDGVSGRAVQSLVGRLGGEAFIYDQSKGVSEREGFNEAIARKSRLVVYSPGFTRDHDWIRVANRVGCRAIPEFDLAVTLWKGPLIAVTGTNGKTTLVSFLHHALQHVGIESYAVGNIGTPLCSLLAQGCNEEAVAVCEVSSFQAETLSEFRADHVLWTNFDEDHLDRHGSMSAYFRSKLNLIVNARSASVFVGRSVYDFGKEIGVDLPESSVVEDELDGQDLGIRGSVFETLPDLKNYLMARAFWSSLNLPEEALRESAFSFTKGPHRMEQTGTIQGVAYWNDSKATNFHASLGGLQRFSRPVLWIGGGKSKGGDLSRFALRLAPLIKSADLLGETKAELGAALQKQGCPIELHDSMESAVRAAGEKANSGDNVVLSPGFASFDMFESYSSRGEAFRKAVHGLEEEGMLR